MNGITPEEKKAILSIFPLKEDGAPSDKGIMEANQMNKGLRFDGIKGTIIVDDEEFSVEFDAVNCFIGNDGIGGYEYFGYKGNDSGRDFVEDYSIEKLVVRSEEGNEVTDPDIIKKVREEVEQSDAIFEKINEQFAGMNEPEYEPDTDPGDLDAD